MFKKTALFLEDGFPESDDITTAELNVGTKITLQGKQFGNYIAKLEPLVAGKGNM